MSDKDWEELKQDLQNPKYVEKFIAAAIKLVISGDKYGES